MNAPRSLYVRLTLVFLAILLALGVSVLWLAQIGASQRSLEVTQRLNEPVARYMVENTTFIDADGLRGEALATLAPHVMTINPSVQVYLLDADGAVVSQDTTLNTIARQHVNLEPIRRFLDDNVEYPVLGDDPQGDTARPFSAWPVTRDGSTFGYIYAVLGNPRHDTLLEALDKSRSTRELALLLCGAVLFAALAGVAVFFTMTRRLRELTRRVVSDRNAASTDEPPAGIAACSASGHLAGGCDEIDELAHAYESMTDQLRSQYERLAASDAERRDLIASVSHDLRTPLTTLAGYLETLELGEQSLRSDERRRYLEIAHRHAQVLRARIDELFELSRLSTDGTTVRPERFSLRELAHDCLQDFVPLAKERDIQLDVKAPGLGHDDALAIDADIALIQRLLENLVDNALRHVDPGGRIGVVLTRNGPHALRVAVHDDGHGMTPYVAKHAFDSWFSSNTESRERGGLGLAIVERIVALHDGTIRLASREGLGTCFMIELPSAAPAPVPERNPGTSKQVTQRMRSTVTLTTGFRQSYSSAARSPIP